MVYDEIIFLDGIDAQPSLRLLEEEGAHALLADLKLYHYHGQHDVVSYDELPLVPDDDEVLRHGLYLLWWNVDDSYCGLAYQLLH